MLIPQISFTSRINTVSFNDNHASCKHINSFIQARDEFVKQNSTAPTFTFCAGDFWVGKSENNGIISKFLAHLIDALTWGNHDLEGGKTSAETARKFNLTWLGCNLDDTKGVFKDVTKNSIILERDNEKIGVIGVCPFDFRSLSHISEDNDFINIKDLDETVEIIKKEVEVLENQGINKIFLLAHTGNQLKDGRDIYSTLAQIGGIDVIFGGHDHVETNYWETSERKEPVKILATGGNRNHFFNENLDVIALSSFEFDDNGVLIKEKCQSVFKYLQEDKKIKKKVKLFAPFKNHFAT